jgi:two-component system response regulator MprA
MENQSPYILVVDDDRDVCDLYVDVFWDVGIPVLVAHDGAEALELLAQKATTPALIILDLTMPGGMDGLTFRSIQKQHEHLATIPTVIVTGSDDLTLPHDPELVGVLTKPISPDILVALAQTHCHR